MTTEMCVAPVEWEENGNCQHPGCGYPWRKPPYSPGLFRFVHEGDHRYQPPVTGRCEHPENVHTDGPPWSCGLCIAVFGAASHVDEHEFEAAPHSPTEGAQP